MPVRNNRPSKRHQSNRPGRWAVRRHPASGAWACQLLGLALAFSTAFGFVEARADAIVAKPIQTSGENDPKTVTALASSPDGARVLTGHFEQVSPDRIEGTARLWDVATGQPELGVAAR